jgi:hypothetical protein
MHPPCRPIYSAKPKPVELQKARRQAVVWLHALSAEGPDQGADRMEPDDTGLHLSGLGSRERNLTPAKARRAE